MFTNKVLKGRSTRIYRLDSASVTAISEKTVALLRDLRYEEKNITIIRLSLEEHLSRWREHFGEETPVRFFSGSRLGRPYLAFELTGERCDPTEETDDESETWSKRISAELGISPAYSYARGKNQLRLDLFRKTINPLLRILIAIALAVVCGLAAGLLPEEARRFLSEKVLEQLSETFFGLLGMVAGPVIFFSILLGVCGIGDVATLGRVGKGVILGFFGLTFGAALVGGVAFPFLFSVRIVGRSDAGTQLNEILTMLFDIVPDNLLGPFVTGNTLQIILLGVAIGIILLMLGKKAEHLVLLAGEANTVMQVMMGWVSSLLPVIVFTVMLKSLLAGSGQLFFTIWKPLLIGVLTIMVFGTLYFLFASARLRISPRLLLHKVLPIFVLGVTTASSTACFGEVSTCCEKKMGISHSLNSFAVPLGMILCMGGCAIDLMVSSMYCASLYHVELSLISVAVAVLTSGMLAIASPPVPGALLACYSILFTQLGLPAEGLVVAMTLNVFFDFFATGVNVTLVPMALTVQARKLGMLDRAVLTSGAPEET